MDKSVIQATCQTGDFTAVEAALRSWDEVEGVGSFREKNNNKKDLTTVFITFRDEESAKAAAAKIATIPGIVPSTAAAGEKQQTMKQSRGKNKNLAADYLKFESYEGKPQREVRDARDGPGKQTGERGGRGRGRGGRRGGRSDNKNKEQKEGRGNGSGRGANGRGNGRGNRSQNGRGRGQRQQYVRPPPFEASVAFVDNVPFGATQQALKEKFSKFGAILDINRFELMAMVCYDNPESVQQCIQHLNGSKINGNVITVSSGTIRIPGEVAMMMEI